MSLQCRYEVGLHRDENPTKNRCRHNIACSLGTLYRMGAELGPGGYKRNDINKSFKNIFRVFGIVVE